MHIEIGPKYQYFKRKDNNFNVYKKGYNSIVCNDKIIIPVLTEIGPESQSFEEYDHPPNVYKNRARIPVFGRIRWVLQCL